MRRLAARVKEEFFRSSRLPQTQNARGVTSNTVKLCLFIALCAGTTLCFGELRTWTDLKGREIQAHYISSTDDTVKVQRDDMMVFYIDISSLSYEDRLYIRNKVVERTVSAREELKRRNMRRDRIYNFNQLDFSYPLMSCSPIVMLNFLMWWDDQLYPSLLDGFQHSNREFQVHRLLTEYSNAQDGTTTAEFKRGLEIFFEKHLPEYGIKFEVKKNPSPKWLQKKASGSSGLSLSIGYYEENDDGYYEFAKAAHAVAVESVRGNRLKLLSWGEEYKVELEEANLDEFILNTRRSPPGMGKIYEMKQKRGPRGGWAVARHDASIVDTAIVFDIYRKNKPHSSSDRVASLGTASSE